METIDRAGSTASVTIKSPRVTLKELFLPTRAKEHNAVILSAFPPIVSGDGRGLSPKRALKKLPPTSARRTEAARHQTTKLRRAMTQRTRTTDIAAVAEQRRSRAKPAAECSRNVRTQFGQAKQSKGKPFDILT